MSDSPEPKRSKGKQEFKPLPRLWKSESDEPEEGSPKVSRDGAAKKSAKQGKVSPSSSTSKSKASSGKTKGSKKPIDADEKEGKKVLLEETPTLDTVESRQRVRLIVGGVGVSVIVLLCWITYRVFLYDPGPKIVAGDEPTLTYGPSEPRSALDQEARFMFNRAREDDKNGRTALAIEMLEKVIKVYKGTPTAADAKTALDRSQHSLPLFVDSPTVLAEAAKAEPAPSPAPPPAVVNAVPEQPRAAQGEANLILPANPSEAIVTPPAARGRFIAAKTGVTPRSLPSGFQPVLEAGVHESGWPLVIVGSRDGAPMVLIPSGTFSMGSDDGQATEGPAHQVHLSAYYIDQHEVTNGQFRTFLKEANYHGRPPGKWLTDDKARAEDPKLPVVMVNAHDAKAFAEWAGKQLSTEAQWEMAARTTDSRRYPWGDEPAKWSRPRTYGQIDPVMTFPEDASPYGVFDLAGNVEEWTKDWYDTKYYRSIADRTTDNPTGPSTHSRTAQFVVKGGSKTFSVSYRHPVPPEKRLPHIGFRCVLSVEAPAPAPAGAQVPPPGAPPGNKPGTSNVPF